jgi:cell wall assembly regulator SMI1
VAQWPKTDAFRKFSEQLDVLLVGRHHRLERDPGWHDRYDFTDPKWWRKEWIPFLHNGGGDHLCLDPMARDFGKPMQIIVFWHDWEDRSVKYESIESWLADLVRSMEERTLVLE